MGIGDEGAVSADAFKGYNLGSVRIEGLLIQAPGAWLFKGQDQEQRHWLVQVAPLKAGKSGQKELVKAVKEETKALRDEQEMQLGEDGYDPQVCPGGALYWQIPWTGAAERIGQSRISSTDGLIAAARNLLERLSSRHKRGRLDPLLHASLIIPKKGGVDLMGVPLAIPRGWLADGVEPHWLSPEERTTGEARVSGDLWRVGEAIQSLGQGLNKSEVLTRWLEKLTAKVPTKRFQSAGQALLELERVDEGEVTLFDPGGGLDLVDNMRTLVPPGISGGMTDSTQPNLSYTEPQKNENSASSIQPMGPKGTVVGVKLHEQQGEAGEVSSEKPSKSQSKISSPKAFAVPNQPTKPANQTVALDKPPSPDKPVNQTVAFDKPPFRGKPTNQTVAFDGPPFPLGSNYGPGGTTPSGYSPAPRTRPEGPGARVRNDARFAPTGQGSRAEGVGYTPPRASPPRASRPEGSYTPPRAGVASSSSSALAEDSSYQPPEPPRRLGLTLVVLVLLAVAAGAVVQLLNPTETSETIPVQSSSANDGLDLAQISLNPWNDVFLETTPASAQIIAEHDGTHLGSSPVRILVPRGPETFVLITAPGFEPMRLPLPVRGRINVILTAVGDGNSCPVRVQAPGSSLEIVGHPDIAPKTEHSHQYTIPGAVVFRSTEGHGAWLVRCDTFGGQRRHHFVSRRIAREVELNVQSPKTANIFFGDQEIGDAPIRHLRKAGFINVRATLTPQTPSGQPRIINRWIPALQDTIIQLPPPPRAPAPASPKGRQRRR